MDVEPWLMRSRCSFADDLGDEEQAVFRWPGALRWLSSLASTASVSVTTSVAHAARPLHAERGQRGVEWLDTTGIDSAHLLDDAEEAVELKQHRSFVRRARSSSLARCAMRATSTGVRAMEDVSTLRINVLRAVSGLGRIGFGVERSIGYYLRLSSARFADWMSRTPHESILASDAETVSCLAAR